MGADLDLAHLAALCPSSLSRPSKPNSPQRLRAAPPPASETEPGAVLAGPGSTGAHPVVANPLWLASEDGQP